MSDFNEVLSCLVSPSQTSSDTEGQTSDPPTPVLAYLSFRINKMIFISKHRDLRPEVIVVAGTSLSVVRGWELPPVICGEERSEVIVETLQTSPISLEQFRQQYFVTNFCSGI